MVGFIKRLAELALGGETRKNHSDKNSTEDNRAGRPEPEHDFVRGPDEYSPGSQYFELLHAQENAVKTKNYAAAGNAARTSLPLIRAWLENYIPKGDTVSISIPALSQGGTMMAICGDDEGLSEMSRLVSEFDQLKMYRDQIKQHYVDRDLLDKIRKTVSEKPGVLQNQMKLEINHDDGRRISLLIGYMAKSGEITRAKEGKTYSLYTSGTDLSKEASQNIYVAPDSPGSHCDKRKAKKPKLLNLQKVPVVRLPPSPKGWESPVILPTTEDIFSDPANAWRDIEITLIAKSKRPEPAFRKHFSTHIGTLSFDDLAKSQTSVGAPGAVMLNDTEGNELSKAPLRRDAYAIAAHPEGLGFAVRSKSNILTVYDEKLKVDFETDLELMPEVRANRQRMAIQSDESHREIRSIALTPDRDRYLLTHIDEAWCVTAKGEVVWGLRMPETEPRHFQAASIVFGTSTEVAQSLTVLGLSMPVTPDEIKLRYRKLALTFHPDLNPDGEEKMKELNLASERLTGLTADELDGSGQHGGSGNGSVTVTITMPGHADWIYASAFSGLGNTALLGSYEGRVVRVDNKGIPTIIYDIGSTPSRIIETEAYLYVMTYTRLYVLSGDKLVALEDCPPKCDLLVSNGLVLLVENKGVRVFSEDGRKLGMALTKAPIRKVYLNHGDLVIETRTHRGCFQGLNLQ